MIMNIGEMFSKSSTYLLCLGTSWTTTPTACCLVKKITAFGLEILIRTLTISNYTNSSLQDFKQLSLQKVSFTDTVRLEIFILFISFVPSTVPITPAYFAMGWSKFIKEFILVSCYIILFLFVLLGWFSLP